ncbi:MAG: UDP-4-amino-4-deoxy-L-arabinose--oxoglutarate aminotransferase [Candidatus Omnitrophica bacterium ADurb.Bin277]|nr:MAG: UDP-4-amino-4-deoxy-L-arabinose--oxoglutarate aminotransferase [Candidatus Omnitrophica bacterium ADurb.Bin277]
MKIPLSKPDVTEREIREVVRVLRTPHLSMGPKLEEFQEKFSRYIGIRYAEAVNSGTSALHLLMKSFGIGKGDEVITSPYSFIASSNCMLFTQARPVFVDIEPQTMTLDANLIEKKITRKTKAILAVHVFGMPADMISINRIARKHGLIVIEDACEAVGAEIGEKKAGSFSDAAVFAFYPNKQITTGEGGMVVTNNRKVRNMCKSLKNQGRGLKGKHFGFLRLGYNYRISDINCALGIAQLSRINEILLKRERVARFYYERLSGVEGIELLREKEGYKRSWFVYVVKLGPRFNARKKKKIMQALARKGIGCGNYFPAIHLEPFYREMFGYRRGDYPVTEATADRTFAIPFYSNLREAEVEVVCRELKRQIAVTG